MRGIGSAGWHRHRVANWLQTVVLILALLGICAFTGSLILGESGLWLALFAGVLALAIEPAAATALTLRLYGARPLGIDEAPAIHRMLRELARRAELPAVPAPHYVASRVVNAFAVGSSRHAAIALTDGLLRSLSPRELAGVLAHEVAHIAHHDLRVMGLADYISRLTHLLAMTGQLMLLVMLPFVLAGSVGINLWGLVALAFSPQLALLAQLGLSRTREFDADLAAARLTGDPAGLASALAKIEQVSRGWRAWLLPGWGNPEPSWLRTHPATHERIARLAELAAHAPPLPQWPTDAFMFETPLRAPRWRTGGLWR
jgi:heat shock protein HtpX